MRIGYIPYVNMAPFYHFLGARWLEQHAMIPGNPRQLGQAAREGKLDAAPFSYVDSLSLIEGGDFEWLEAMGVIGQGPIRSILLCGCADPKALAGQAIAVTPQTSTTVRLMEVWLRERHGVLDYRLSGPDDNAAARLFIGDDALRRKLELGATEPQIDLCNAWTEWTGLPFVFARWAVRKDVPARAKVELTMALRSALDLALHDLRHVAETQAERIGLPADEIEPYLKGIRYRLGEEELKGAQLFEEKLARLA